MIRRRVPKLRLGSWRTGVGSDGALRVLESVVGWFVDRGLAEFGTFAVVGFAFTEKSVREKWQGSK